jgi:hypothetical protein
MKLVELCKGDTWACRQRVEILDKFNQVSFG